MSAVSRKHLAVDDENSWDLFWIIIKIFNRLCAWKKKKGKRPNCKKHRTGGV